AADIAPDDPVATFHRCSQNVGALAVDRFDDAAGLMSGTDRQRIAARQRPMPAVHISAAKPPSTHIHPQSARLWVIGASDSLNLERFVMTRADSRAIIAHISARNLPL